MRHASVGGRQQRTHQFLIDHVRVFHCVLMTTNSLRLMTLHVPWLPAPHQCVTRKCTLVFLHYEAKYTSGRLSAGRKCHSSVGSRERLRDYELLETSHLSPQMSLAGHTPRQTGTETLSWSLTATLDQSSGGQEQYPPLCPQALSTVRGAQNPPNKCWSNLMSHHHKTTTPPGK